MLCSEGQATCERQGPWASLLGGSLSLGLGFSSGSIALGVRCWWDQREVQ